MSMKAETGPSQRLADIPSSGPLYKADLSSVNSGCCKPGGFRSPHSPMAGAGLPRTQLLQALLWSLDLPINHPFLPLLCTWMFTRTDQNLRKAGVFYGIWNNRSASVAEQCCASRCAGLVFLCPGYTHSWLDARFLRGPFNETLPVRRRQFAHLTYIVQGTAYLNLDSVSDEVFWLSNTSLMLFKIFWQMGKLFQSDLSNTLLQYFATWKRIGKGIRLFPEITPFLSPQEEQGLHSVRDYNMCVVYAKISCDFSKREHLGTISKQGTLIVL